MKENKNTTIVTLQKYVPLILEDERYFSSFVSIVLDKYDFEVNEKNLRKKLHKFLDASFRTDNLSLSNRLIRGQFNYESDMDWIWVGSNDVSRIAYKVIAEKCI